MTDTNCTEVSKNALTNQPKLLDDSQLKINTDLMDIVRKSTAASLFKKDGIPLSKLLSFNCTSKSGLAELKPPNPIISKLSLCLAYKDGAAFANLRCRF